MLDRGIALVPETRELFGGLPVEDNLLLGGFRRWMTGKGIDRARLDKVYQTFPRLHERRLQPAATLSGAFAQKVPRKLLEETGISTESGFAPG